MRAVDTLVIGAGQAGLAMSRCLTDAAVDHVVLDRGRLGERWRSERWDSLRLLTPNWATRLPGWSYTGDDPHGFMRAGELVEYFERYAASFGAPVIEDSPVTALRRTDEGFVVHTEDSSWRAERVVLATGWCDQPRIPTLANRLATTFTQVTPSSYRSPGQLPAGAVVVVGASASGVQIADELAAAGRDVVLAVGRHSRVPRRYRGLDIWWWMDQLGTFAKTIDKVSDVERARREGSLQLVGRSDHRDVDLPTLQARGVTLAGRLVGIDGARARFADDLAATTADAADRLQRILGDIDRYIATSGLENEVLPPAPIASITHGNEPRQLDLRSRGVSTVVWATGFTRPYPWLHVPVLDRAGEIHQRRGLTPVPGLYVLGQRFQHRRDSNFIDGVRHDAAYVAELICRGRQPARLAS
jgi:putative flavoprotein involved in K+ transport